MALEAAMQRAVAEVGNGVLQAAQQVVQRQQRLLAERPTMASSAGVSTVLFGAFGPIDASLVVGRLRYLRTVFAFRP